MQQNNLRSDDVFALEVSDVIFRFYEKGKKNILDRASLTVEAGKLTVLMGSSGCGKSTLAAVAAGLYPENGGFLLEGSMRLFGRALTELNPRTRAEYLSVMFQNPDLQFCMATPEKELYFCMENMAVPAEEMKQRAMETAALFGIEPFFTRPFHTLSGGEKQMVSLACLYAVGSKMIILDEAFANIDEVSAKRILQLLMKMKAQGTTILAIDHRLDLWLEEADEIVILTDGGKVLKRGLNRENIGEARAVFRQEGLFFPGEAKEKYTAKHACEGTEAFHEDENDAALEREEHLPACESAVCFTDVTIPVEVKKRFGKIVSTSGILIENTSFEVPAGSVTALLGKSGSGKTTTFLSLMKKHPYFGTIRLFGEDVRKMKPRDLYRKAGFVFQNPANQFVTQKVEDEVVSGLKIWHPEWTEAEILQETERLLRAFGLESKRRLSPYMLSQGQQRRLAVLSVLSGGQKLLLLDEPTYGQDDRSTEGIMRELLKKRDEEGLTVIMITHDRELAARYADRILVLEDKVIRVKAESDKQEPEEQKQEKQETEAADAKRMKTREGDAR